jgi:putative transposase
VSDNNVIKFAQPGGFSDSLTEILRSGARALLTQAIEAEVADFLAKHADLKTATGQQRVVRHGHLPERAIMTGIAILYLKGISTGDFEEALAALVGKDAPGLSASTIARLKSLPSRKRGRRGARSMRAGRSATCRQSATSTSGPTASI